MSLITRLRGMLRRDRLDRDLDEELRSHLEMRAADNLAAGMSPGESRREAQKRFGNTLSSRKTLATPISSAGSAGTG